MTDKVVIMRNGCEHVRAFESRLHAEVHILQTRVAP